MVLVSKADPEWLEDADENIDRGPWVWERGVGDLGFAHIRIAPAEKRMMPAVGRWGVTRAAIHCMEAWSSAASCTQLSPRMST